MAEIKLGNKHECGSCGTKFYDFGRSKAICPRCGADQKKIASHGRSGATPGRRRPPPDVEEDSVDGIFGDDRGDLDAIDLDAPEVDEED